MLERIKPEDCGVSSLNIINFLDSIERNQLEIHGLMILKDQKVITEAYYHPFKELPHALFSLSKSFTSTAIGFAVSEGLLTVDDLVIHHFKEDCPEEIDENLAVMRVKDLLMMSTGHEQDTANVVFNDQNPVKAFLSQVVRYQPGTHFLYNNGATYMLSALITKLTGISLLDYLMPRLFNPLGIEQPTWEANEQGINYGAFGLSLKVEDIAKFGLLYLNKGFYNGNRILNEEWIHEATTKQVDNKNGGDWFDWQEGYGYQFWMCRYDAYRGDGAFGQYCIVLPKHQVVIAITSTVDNMQQVMDLIWTHLLPAFENSHLMIESDHELLLEKITHLKHKPRSVNHSSPLIRDMNNKLYKIEENQTISEVTLKFNDQDGLLTYVEQGDVKTVKFGLGFWLFNERNDMCSSGTWLNDSTFILENKELTTPFTYTSTFKFVENELICDVCVNRSFGPKELASFKGKMMI